MAPDALIVQDVTLIQQVDLFAGLAPDGYVLVNTSRSFDELGLGEFLGRFRRERLLTCPATEIARRHLGRPWPNSSLLGGFAALTGQVSLEALGTAIGERFAAATAEGNVAAAAAAFGLFGSEEERLTGAPSD
jgi:pyruvate ferredoxin oxidoreductase gamma subunit